MLPTGRQPRRGPSCLSWTEYLARIIADLPDEGIKWLDQPAAQPQTSSGLGGSVPQCDVQKESGEEEALISGISMAN
jgi:hypothetical protein